MVENDRPGKIFVGGLAMDIDEKLLENTFSKFGRLTEVLLIRDKISNNSRGYGFVTFENPLDAEDAVKSMEGAELHGKTIHAEQAVRSLKDDRDGRARRGSRMPMRGGSGRGRSPFERTRRYSDSRRSPPPRRGGFSSRGGARGGISSRGSFSRGFNSSRDYSPPSRKAPMSAGPPRREFDGPPRRMSHGDRRDDRNGFRERSYSPRPVRDSYPPLSSGRDSGRLIESRGPPPRSRDYPPHEYRETSSRDNPYSRDYSPEPIRSRDYDLPREDRAARFSTRSSGPSDYLPPRASEFAGSRDIGRDYSAPPRDYGSRERDRDPIDRGYPPRDAPSSGGRGGRYSSRTSESRAPPRDYPPSRDYEDDGPPRRSMGSMSSRGPPPSQSRGPPMMGSPRGESPLVKRRMERPSFNGSSSRRSAGPPPSRGPPPIKRSRMDGPPRR